MADTSDEVKDKALLKAQRKALFEAQNKERLNAVLKDKETKSKAELKAERRNKQEIQRMAKKAPQTQDPGLKQAPSKVNQVTNEVKIVQDVKNDSKNDVKTDTKTEKSVTKAKTVVSNISPTIVKRDQIFAHIPKRIKDLNQLSEELYSKNIVIHPIVIEIGFRINRDLIRGSNSRCVAMLYAFKTVIEDYETPPSKELIRDLESLIETYVKFLAKCRPLSISMTNAVKFLKQTFSRIPAQTNDSTAKSELCNAIDYFISDEIMCAQKGIAVLATTKVHDDDVILTFGCSLIVQHVIHKAHQKGKRFRVIVVDSRPRFDGRQMLSFLAKLEIPSTYVFINAISYVMKEVTKVLLGAHSLLANGYVKAHLGSSQIALVAQAYNVPVLVCCETYKFSERVETDSFVHNEIGGDSSEHLNSLSICGKSQIDANNKDINFLDLLYDVTPHEYISVVITEKGVLPCTSAPAVLRVRETK